MQDNVTPGQEAKLTRIYNALDKPDSVRLLRILYDEGPKYPFELKRALGINRVRLFRRTKKLCELPSPFQIIQKREGKYELTEFGRSFYEEIHMAGVKLMQRKTE